MLPARADLALPWPIMPNEMPWHAWALMFPRAIAKNLERVREHGVVREVPNHWQITLGVVRMWARLAFRPETVGMSRGHPVRPTWRARVLAYRPLRFPFLLKERAVAPLDYSGLASPPERIIRHLLGAHHDGAQFVYDLELLSAHPGKLDDLHRRVLDIVGKDDARSRWMRDLCVFDRYHENLLAAVEDALAHGPRLPEPEASDPDISFVAYMRWCALQPATPAATLAAIRRGELDLGPTHVPTEAVAT
jgi:hypothetical protein